jgi:hypothetical protein
VVSEKKLEMWKVYRRRTPSDGNSTFGPGELKREITLHGQVKGDNLTSSFISKNIEKSFKQIYLYLFHMHLLNSL